MDCTQCRVPHPLDKPHVFCTLKCRICKKTVSAQDPHPTIKDGSWLVHCEPCDLYSVLNKDGVYEVVLEPHGELLQHC